MKFNRNKIENGSDWDSSSVGGVPILPLELCLAKTKNENEPGCAVLDHLIWVGKIAEELWERSASEVRKLLPKDVVVALAALHDIGKISPGFQRKIWKNVETDRPNIVSVLLCCEEGNRFDDKESTDHSLLGEVVLQDKFERWSEVVARHHGNDICGLTRDYEPNLEIFGGDDWQSLRIKAASRVLAVFNLSFDDLSCTTEETQDMEEETLDLATGFVVVADWLGSDERFCPDGKIPSLDVASQRVCEILNEIGWIAPQPLENKSFHGLFSSKEPKTEFIPNETQRRFYDVAKEPGVFVIEAPTGLGKTEAALYGAYRLTLQGNSGIYFALPTRTTSDKIYERVVPFVERAFDGNFDVRLAHGLAWTYFADVRSKSKVEQDRERDEDRKNFYIVEDWFRPSKRALLQTFGVGTIDQSLLGVLPVKHNFLRLFGLAGKVVIFDEAHSYDQYTGALLDALIRQLEKLGTSVIVLSATLTGERRAQLLGERPSETTVQEVEEASREPYPLISYRYYSGSSGRVDDITPPSERIVELEAMERSPNRVAEIAVENAKRGALVLCVTNTVDKAQQLYNLVMATSVGVPAERIGLLHSRFPSWRREEIESSFLNMFGKSGDRSQGAILVSTQVVEQSVDIDADLLITDLAPTDMLIQRIGRLWRHKREKRPVATARAIVVYPPDEGGSFQERVGVDGCVYQPYVLWRTAEVWRSRTKISIPNDVRNLLESTYATREETGEAEEMKEEVEDNTADKIGEVEKITSGYLPLVSDRNTSLTRYSDSETLDILIVRNIQQAPTPSVTTLDGKTISLDGYRRLSDAVALCRNTISRRKRYSDPDWSQEAQGNGLYKLLVKTYFKYSENFVIFQWDEKKERLLTLKDEPTDLMYKDRLGLYDIRSLTSCNEEAAKRSDEFEEGEEDDDYYDDFEW